VKNKLEEMGTNRSLLDNFAKIIIND